MNLEKECKLGKIETHLIGEMEGHTMLVKLQVLRSDIHEEATKVEAFKPLESPNKP